VPNDDLALPESLDELREYALRMRAERDAAVESGIHAVRENVELKTTIERKDAEYAELKRLVFGARSEKLKETIPGQGELFNEAERDVDSGAPEEERVQIIKRRLPRKGGRKRPPVEVERVERLHDLADDEKACPCCGLARPRIGEDRSEEIEIVPARAVVIVHVRPKYGPCACDGFKASGKSAIVQGSAPAKIAPGSLFSNKSVAFFIVAKYADGLPFHRQEKVVARMGIEVAQSTMARLAIRVESRIGPLIERIRNDIRGSPVVGMDETVLQMLKEPDRSPTSESRMWVARAFREGRPILFFVYNPTRGKNVAQAILGEDFRGFLQTDGYSGYTELGQHEGIVHVGCWAHIRRKFHHLCDQKVKDSLALAAVGMIGELYEIERTLRKKLEAGSIAKSEFCIRRKKETAPVFTRIQAWLFDTAPRVPPESPIGKAISYAIGQLDRAVRYVDHVLLTGDNNPVLSSGIRNPQDSGKSSISNEKLRKVA